MRDLRPLLRTAQAHMASAREDLRVASARHAGQDPTAALRLAQLAAGMGRALTGLPRDIETPTAPDPAVVAAGKLHEAVATAFGAVLGLWEAGEAARPIIEVPGAALFHPGDRDLFGCEPGSDAFDGWTSPLDGQQLDRLALTRGSDAWRRREMISHASSRWAENHQAAVEAAGVVPLRDCMTELHGVLVEIRIAMAQVNASTVAAARAKARAAARSLIELGDDPDDLSGVARLYAGQQDSGSPESLAWTALGDFLASEAQR